MTQTINQRRTLKMHDHIKPAARVPRQRKPAIWDIETIIDMVKGAVALTLAGIAAGLSLMALHLIWDHSGERLAFVVAQWLSQ